MGNGEHVASPSVVLHFKIIAAPAISADTMLAAAQQVYQLAGIDVRSVSTEVLAFPEFEDLEVGMCKRTQLTSEQVQLHRNRGGAGATDIVAFFVRQTVPPMNGCAAHPVGSPGFIVAHHAPLWTLAHELGHVLGLKHVKNADRLMTEWGTANITNPPPDLSAAEVRRLLSSPLVVQS